MALNFQILQERLRRVIRLRIESGQLTRLKLAQLTGFQQAHISNFVSSRRGLSLQAMDAVMDVCQISLLDLLQPSEFSQRIAYHEAEPGYQTIAVVSGVTAAHEPVIAGSGILDTDTFPSVFLNRLRSEAPAERKKWERFVLIKLETADGLSMFPRLLPHALVLIDRHYTSLIPYRKHDRNMYAVRTGKSCTIKYVEISGSNLVLRPHNPEYPVNVISMDSNRSHGDHVVGRVCHVAIET